MKKCLFKFEKEEEKMKRNVVVIGMMFLVVMLMDSKVSAVSDNGGCYTNEQLVAIGLGDDYETDEPIKIWFNIDSSVRNVFLDIYSFPGEEEIVTVTLQILKGKGRNGENIACGAVTIHQPGEYVLSLRLWKGWGKKSEVIKKRTTVKKGPEHFESCK